MSEQKKDTAAPEQTVPISVVEALIAKIQAIAVGGGAGAGMTAEQFQDILASNAKEHAEAINRMILPENKIIPQISVFSYPEGDTARPKPILKDRRGNPRETIFCGARQREELLTPAEIDAFNAITDNVTARDGKWLARIRREGQREYLWVHVPCVDVDQRMELPSLLAILMELKSGPKSVDLETLTNELKTLRDKLAAAGVTV